MARRGMRKYTCSGQIRGKPEVVGVFPGGLFSYS
jgi:hypothetical protein